MRVRPGKILLLLLICFVSGLSGGDSRAGDYSISWYVITSGVGQTSASNARMGVTLGESVVGATRSMSDGDIMRFGFWQDYDFSGACDCRPGDADGDAAINVGDAVYIINFIFKAGPPPTPYATCSGDPNADCAVNIGDAVYLISYIFKGGPMPVSCEEWRSICGNF